MSETSKNRHAAALGKRGGKAGKGKAKARTSEQARAAAKARWSATAERNALMVAAKELLSAYNVRLADTASTPEIVAAIEALTADKHMDDAIATEEYLNGD